MEMVFLLFMEWNFGELMFFMFIADCGQVLLATPK